MNIKKLILILTLFISTVGLTKLCAAESSPQYLVGIDTLVVYKDVPGLMPSDDYILLIINTI